MRWTFICRKVLYLEKSLADLESTSKITGLIHKSLVTYWKHNVLKLFLSICGIINHELLYYLLLTLENYKPETHKVKYQINQLLAAVFEKINHLHVLVWKLVNCFQFSHENFDSWWNEKALTVSLIEGNSF